MDNPYDGIRDLVNQFIDQGAPPETKDVEVTIQWLSDMGAKAEEIQGYFGKVVEMSQETLKGIKETLERIDLVANK